VECAAPHRRYRAGAVVRRMSMIDGRAALCELHCSRALHDRGAVARQPGTHHPGADDAGAKILMELCLCCRSACVRPVPKLLAYMDSEKT